MSTLREMGDGELVGMYTERKRNTVDCSILFWHKFCGILTIYTLREITALNGV